MVFNWKAKVILVLMALLLLTIYMISLESKEHSCCNDEKPYEELCSNTSSSFKDLLKQKKECYLERKHDLENDQVLSNINLLIEFIQNQEDLKPPISIVEFSNTDELKNSQFKLELFIRSKMLATNPTSPIELKMIKELIFHNNLNSYQDFHNFTNLISTLAKHYHSIHQQEKLFTTILYGLHILADNFKDFDLTAKKDELISYFNIYALREENSEEYTNTSRMLMSMQSNQFQSTFNGLLYRAYYEEELKRQNLPDQNLKYLKYAEKKAATKKDHNIIYHNLGYYYSLDSTMLDSSFFYYEKALKQYSNVTCDFLYFQLLLYILSNDMPSYKSDKYISKLDSVQYCDPLTQNYVKFIKPIYVEPQYIHGNNYEKLDNLLEQSKAASLSFPGKSSLHLQDYFISNLSVIINLFHQGQKIEPEYHNSIINKFLEVRQRDHHRQSIVKNNILSDDHRNEVSQMLLKINNFKSLKPLISPIYKELFQKLIMEEETKGEDHNFLMDSIDLNSLPKEKYIVNILKDSKFYISYVYGKNDLWVFRESTTNIDSIGQEYYTTLSSNRDSINNLNFLSSINKIVAGKDINLIGDGILQHLPPDHYLPDARSTTSYLNAKQIASANTIYISESKIDLFSYSSSETIASKKTKDYPDLPFGLKEVNEINNLLPDASVISGNDFIKETILNKSTDFVHISSHAKSDPTNALNNYIITKSPEEKLFGFELYDGNIELPKVVILSTCESGIGLHAYGAGVQTLSRAFLDNGTQTVIKTLWKVNEKATAEFMIEMYQHWVTGISLYDALEDTKNNFKEHKEYSHPYYWAGFVLEGNPHVYLDLENVEERKELQEK